VVNIKEILMILNGYVENVMLNLIKITILVLNIKNYTNIKNYSHYLMTGEQIK